MINQVLDANAAQLKAIDLPALPDRPLISVIIANYNYGQYVGEAIESALRQSYSHLEVVVCDDGSTDNSRELIARYEQQDSRVRLLSKENGGAASAMNTAYAASHGDIICLLDADDVFLPEKLEKVVTAFKRSPRSGTCIHRLLKMDSAGRTFSYPRPLRLVEGWVGDQALHHGGRVSRMLPSASTMSFRRPVTDLLFPIGPHLRRLADGYLFGTSQFITEICVVHETLAHMRIHSDNISSAREYTADFVIRLLADMKSLLNLQKDFLARHYGGAVADQLRLENDSHYWSFLLALHLLSDGASQEVCGEPLNTVVNHIHPFRQRLLARILLGLPRRVSQQALRAWTGPSTSTAMIAWTARHVLRI